MATTNPAAVNATPSVGGANPGKLNLQILAPENGADSGDAAQFRAALERHMNARSEAGPAGKPSLAEKISGRVTNLASDIQKDQQYVSKLLEQAARTGDSMQLMKAMMALNDYSIRVQTIAKTVSKSTQGFETLTKLQ